VLTLHGRHIAEITSFLGADHFRPFGLPASLSRTRMVDLRS
jgi:RNA polymerase sigma-70 factor, ECF subfamily